jgi:hypothetical protein
MLTSEQALVYESLFNHDGRITNIERGFCTADDQIITTGIRRYGSIGINEVDHDVDENSDDYFVDAVEAQAEGLALDC